MLNVSNKYYGGLADSNFSNVEFFYQNDTIIHSWLENYTYPKYALWWLKLAGGIPADSNVTIYMGFTSNDTNLLNQQMTGEAPQLSGVYAEYDDGADTKIYVKDENNKLYVAVPDIVPVATPYTTPPLKFELYQIAIDALYLEPNSQIPLSFIWAPSPFNTVLLQFPPLKL